MGTVRRSVGKSKAKRSTSRPWVKFLKWTLVVGSLVRLVGVGSGFAYMYASVRAAEPLVDTIGERIKEYNSKPSRILSSDGKLLYEIKPIYRESISLTSLPKHVKYAILAAEDKRFYEHNGVDYMGLGRAVFNFTKRGGEASGGGSTITMQLAKKLFSASEMTMKRKIQDISIAFNLEKRYTKDQILELYINQIYYGEQAYGLNAAAEIYFGKEAQDLDVAEAAMIARCIRLPSSQNPVRNYQVADANKKVVLNAMLEEGWITQDEYEKAKEEKPKVRGFSKQKFSKTYAAPYFVAAVKRDLERQGINISEGGYTVTTTLDSKIQDVSEQETERVIRGSEANVGAFICMDSEGRILADVGGRNYAKNQFSYTTQSALQPGSSFKSFVYAEALKNGMINEDSELDNSEYKERESRNKVYIPKGGHGVGGTVDLFTAFTQSWNLPAIHTFVNMGKVQAANSIKEDFGFDSQIRPVASAALGSNEVRAVEMLEGYSVFALDGRRVQPYRIREVIDSSGETVYQGKMEYVNTSISPSVCATMDKLMRGVVTAPHATGHEAAGCPDARGKTGTTNDGKSLWFCGYSKGIIGIAVAANQHYDKKRKKWLLGPLEQFGGDVAAPIWAAGMSAAVAKYGSDVKPDFSKKPESSALKHKKKPDENPDANNEEPIPAPDDTNSAPMNDGGTAPATGDGDTNGPKGDGATDVPQRDPASDPGTDVPPVRNDIPPKAPKTDAKGRKTVETETVEVEVCADSGMLATRYCPETISKTFPKNKRPRKRCTLHKPPDEGGGGL